MILDDKKRTVLIPAHLVRLIDTTACQDRGLLFGPPVFACMRTHLFHIYQSTPVLAD